MLDIEIGRSPPFVPGPIVRDQERVVELGPEERSDAALLRHEPGADAQLARECAGLVR